MPGLITHHTAVELILVALAAVLVGSLVLLGYRAWQRSRVTAEERGAARSCRGRRPAWGGRNRCPARAARAWRGPAPGRRCRSRYRARAPRDGGEFAALT